MHFTDITNNSGLLFSFFRSEGPISQKIGGCVAEDFDRDGFIDLYISQGNNGTCHLYMNDGDGTFSEEGAARGANLSINAHGAAGADYDNDGDIDICVSRENPPHLLLINDGTGHFIIDSTTIVLPSSGVTTSPSWGDITGDGLLDLVLGQWDDGNQNLWLFQNQGGGVLKSYEFQTGFIGQPFNNPRVYSPRFVDFNGDRLSDLLVASDFYNSQAYVNVGGGLFKHLKQEDIGIGNETNGMGAAIGDYDNDGDLDWYVTSISINRTGEEPLLGSRLYRNEGKEQFTDVSETALVTHGYWGWAASFGDLDLDGDLDLFSVNGWDGGIAYRLKPAVLFENLGDGTFEEVASSANADNIGEGRGMVLFDMDNDGDLDIYICNSQTTLGGPGIPALLRNDTVTPNHWLKVTLEGQPPFHRDGIGSRVYVTTGSRRQFRELHASTNFLAQEPGRIAHFGLGETTKIDEVRAEWLNGCATILINVAVDQAIYLPSPAAIISASKISLEKEITATGVSAEPLDARRDWIVQGQTYADPVILSFSTTGLKELRFNLYEPDGSTILRSEVFRVRVTAATNTMPDFNRDGDIDALDLHDMLEKYGMGHQDYDLDKDGINNFRDHFIFGQSWGVSDFVPFP